MEPQPFLAIPSAALALGAAVLYSKLIFSPESCQALGCWSDSLMLNLPKTSPDPVRFALRPWRSRLSTAAKHPAINRPMATPRHPVNAVQFRLGRIQRDWHDITAILREAAADPGYAGPDIDVLEKIEEVIAGVRVGVRNWILAGGPPRRTPQLRGRERAAVLHAISEAVASRR
jgi:hypothetical protein